MPRIRPRRHRAVTVTAPRPSEPRIAVLEEAGLRWIQIESPGAANKELVALFAERFGVPKSAVTIRGGAAGRMKWIEISG